VHATGAGKATGTGAEGEQRRLFDDRGRVSMVVPATWRKLPTEADNELLFVALKGIKGGPRLLVTDWGGPASAGLTLTKILSRWKRDYSSVVGEVLKGDPPRMLVRNRVPGSVDYLIAFAARDRGYTLGLTVSAGSYENYRTLADAVAKTIVFEGGAWHEPEIKGFDVETPHKKLVVVHSDTEHDAAASRVVKELPAFEKHWNRIGIGDAKHAPPLHVVVTTEEDFARASNYFGAAPAAYDPSACTVVIVTPPEGKDEYAMWNGQLYRALARAAIHRDFKSGVPPWIEAGLAACMDAAGRSGKGPDEANPALLPRLQLRASSDSARPLEEVFDLDANRVFRAETPDDLAVAWGYTHLMLFGKGSLGSLYKRWVKELEKAHGTWPVFDLKGYDQAAQDLKRHVEKLWGT